MSDTTNCPECGSALPESAPLGMCPQCLLRSARGHTLVGDRRAEPPSCAELEELFAGRFAIKNLLGRGGMGAVYQARQCRIDRPVAIKLLPFLDEDPEYLERFLREARALGKLSHPNIVTLIDYGEIGGYFYMVMEFVEGGDLANRLTSGPLSEEEIVPIIFQICDALDYAHRCGVVHRDIKPANILLGENGTVKLVDFGLAKGMEAGDADLTWANEMMGTPNYMSPEQRTNPLKADHRSDIFALGVLTFEMLTGELPLGNFALPSKLNKVSRSWDRIILKAMATDPGQRYSSAKEMEGSVKKVARKPKLLLQLLSAASLVLLIGLSIHLFKDPPVPASEAPGRESGRVVAFGSNLYGQVSKLGSLERDDIVAVAANDEHHPDYCFALALTDGGEVISLGDAPPEPENLQNISSIAVGLAHCLALSDEGKVIAWGFNQPPLPKDLPPIKQITAAGRLSAALSVDGEVFVWGTTVLGNSLAFSESENKNIVEIKAATDAIIARTTEGKLLFQGDPDSPVMKYREADQPLKAIAAGEFYGMGLLHNNLLWSWGWDSLNEAPPNESSGFITLISGPETSAVQTSGGDWASWGKIGPYFPEWAEGALDIDFGHHVGLAVVPAHEVNDYSPPPLPKPLEKLAVLGPHSGEVKSLVCNSDRTRLYAATGQAIHCYDLKQNVRTSESYRATSSITALTWDHHQDRLIAASDSGKVIVFNVVEFPVVTQEFNTESASPLASIAIDPSGKTLFAGDREGFISMWDTTKFNPSGTVQLHQNAITGIAITDDRLFTSSWDKTLKVSDLSGGSPRGIGEILKTPVQNHELNLTPNGSALLSSDWRGTVYQLDLITLETSRSWLAHPPQSSKPSTWLGTDAYRRVGIGLSPDGRFIATAGGDNFVRIWNAHRNELIAKTPNQLPNQSHVVTFLDQNRIVTAGEAGNALAIWQLPVE